MYQVCIGFVHTMEAADAAVNRTLSRGCNVSLT
jgi:hypothetical protein